MSIISSRQDIVNYVTNVRYDVHVLGLTDALVEAIRDADHPAFGEDWSDWLDANVDALLVPLHGNQGDLVDYRTGETIRKASVAELRASRAAAATDGGAGVINVDGVSCYVQE
jgi:hypothetical protein